VRARDLWVSELCALSGGLSVCACSLCSIEDVMFSKHIIMIIR